ncbi:hypothetical protein HYH02_014464 [Chlamydomonas schloesseri]|uniref:Uncharacterized protein n=1 Tax=Chlamydomonas schloesseri TaxID=2026947 RepID=A0A835SN09_9CHLO|nr:hypothetical protein HYH02_014464 [Chlamydomonas schloesseri]|eukprot:KAG2428072.1 hypothetical protein HYH02_014464 [Chlamydomonas schloesseri]
MTPAVALAPLHGRLVGLALAGKEGWDAAVGTPAAFLDRAEAFVALLRRKNGKTWWAKPAAVQLRAVGDASDLGYGALLPEGELGAASCLSVPYTPQELARLLANDFSSTEREVRAALTALQWVEAQRPGSLQGKRVQYQID